MDDLMAHILHTLKLVGPDHVGIGLDLDGGGGVTGLDDVADIPEITRRLIAAGYSEADLAKIWSGNVLRLLREAEAKARRDNTDFGLAGGELDPSPGVTIAGFQAKERRMVKVIDEPDESELPDLGINPEKVCHVIVKARAVRRQRGAAPTRTRARTRPMTA